MAAIQIQVRRLPVVGRIGGWQLILGLGLLAGLTMWGSVFVRSVTVYPTTVLFTQERSIGLPPPVEDLDFGDVPAGLPISRKVILENDGRSDVYVGVVAIGGIRGFMENSDMFFSMTPGETKDIDFTVHAPVNMTDQRYDGTVFIFRLPWFNPTSPAMAEAAEGIGE